MSYFACPLAVPDKNPSPRRYTLVNPLELPEMAKYHPGITPDHLEISICLAILSHVVLILATFRGPDTAICHIDEAIGGYTDLNTVRNYP